MGIGRAYPQRAAYKFFPSQLDTLYISVTCRYVGAAYKVCVSVFIDGKWANGEAVATALDIYLPDGYLSSYKSRCARYTAFTSDFLRAVRVKCRETSLRANGDGYGAVSLTKSTTAYTCFIGRLKKGRRRYSGGRGNVWCGKDKSLW